MAALVVAAPGDTEGLPDAALRVPSAARSDGAPVSSAEVAAAISDQRVIAIVRARTVKMPTGRHRSYSRRDCEPSKCHW